MSKITDMISGALSAAKSAEQKAASTISPENGWGSRKFILVIAFAGLLVYLTKGLLTPELYDALKYVVVAYLLCNTVMSSVKDIMNGLIIIAREKREAAKPEPKVLND